MVIGYMYISYLNLVDFNNLSVCQPSPFWKKVEIHLKSFNQLHLSPIDFITFIDDNVNISIVS